LAEYQNEPSVITKSKDLCSYIKSINQWRFMRIDISLKTCISHIRWLQDANGHMLYKVYGDFVLTKAPKDTTGQNRI
jgi:hypothetical protein